MIRRLLPRQREKPRRNEGRVSHERIKPKASVEPSAREKCYWDGLPDRCTLCGEMGTVIHHILAAVPGKRSRRDHRFVVRLCPPHHNMGTWSVHLLGSEAKFLEEHGCDLVAASVSNWTAFDAGNP